MRTHSPPCMRPLKLARRCDDNPSRRNSTAHQLLHHRLRTNEPKLEIRRHSPKDVGVSNKNDTGLLIRSSRQTLRQLLELLKPRRRNLRR
jgi:hypothetical protein